MTSILNAMIYSLSSFYSSVNLIIRSLASSEPATMTSSKLISSMSKSISESASMTSSMQWSSHRSIYQWIDSPISSRATSESATMTSSKSISSMSKSISESATIDISILHKAKKIHSCKHESLKRESNVTILATHLCW